MQISVCPTCTMKNSNFHFTKEKKNGEHTHPEQNEKIKVSFTVLSYQILNTPAYIYFKKIYLIPMSKNIVIVI